MSKTLSGIRAIVRQFISDEFVSGAEYDFEEDELDLYISDTLSEISERRPYEVKETLKTTADSKELDISSIDDLFDIPKIEFRTSEDPPAYRNCSIFGNTLTMAIDFKPLASENVYLYCHKVHQLTEDTSTLNPQLERVLVAGAVPKLALAWVNKIRGQVKEAIALISSVHTSIGAMAGTEAAPGPLLRAAKDLADGRLLIGTKHDKALAAIDAITGTTENPGPLPKAITDLATGRELIGSKKAEAIAALAAIEGTTGEPGPLPLAIADLKAGRDLMVINRDTAKGILDGISGEDGEIKRAIADLTTGRDLGFNKVYIGGRPLTDLSNYAARELNIAHTGLNQFGAYLAFDTSPAGQYGNLATRDLQAVRAMIDEARGYISVDYVTAEFASYALRGLNAANSLLSQARGYVELHRIAILQYGNSAARELSIATTSLNQAGGYTRELSSRLSIAGVINSYQTWANNKLVLYQGEIKRLIRPKTYTRYPTS
ncbi:hypothetical protein ES707_09195 [subsurface metagenome]